MLRYLALACHSPGSMPAAALSIGNGFQILFYFTAGVVCLVSPRHALARGGAASRQVSKQVMIPSVIRVSESRAGIGIGSYDGSSSSSCCCSLSLALSVRLTASLPLSSFSLSLPVRTGPPLHWNSSPPELALTPDCDYPSLACTMPLLLPCDVGRCRISLESRPASRALYLYLSPPRTGSPLLVKVHKYGSPELNYQSVSTVRPGLGSQGSPRQPLGPAPRPTDPTTH